MSDDFTKTCLESELQTLGNWLDSRDAIIRKAYEGGIVKSRIHRLTGIARTTIDRIVGTNEHHCKCCGNTPGMGGTRAGHSA